MYNIEAILDKFKKHVFFKNFSFLFLASLFSQLLALGVMPILSRIYDEEAFGILSTSLSAINIIYSIGVFGYHIPIVIEKRKNISTYIFQICKYIIIIVSIVAALIFLLPLNIFNPYKNTIPLIGLGSLAMLMNLIYNQQIIRRKLFKLYAKISLIKNFLILFFQIVIYYITSLYGLIIGQVIAYFALNIYIKKSVRIENMVLTKGRTNFFLHRYIDFPKFFLPSNLIESISSNLPIIILGVYYPLATIGLLGLAYKIVLQPINLVASNINSIIMAEMAEMKNNNRHIYKWYLKMFLLLTILTSIISICILFFSKPLFPVIFGERWTESANMAIMLVPLFFGLSIKTIGNATIRVFEKQKSMLIFTVSSLSIRFIVIYTLIKYTDNILYILLIYSFTTLCLVIVEQIYLIYVIRQYDQNIKRVKL